MLLTFASVSVSDLISNYHDKARLAPRAIRPFLEPHEALNFGRVHYVNTADAEHPDQSESEDEGDHDDNEEKAVE